MMVSANGTRAEGDIRRILRGSAAAKAIFLCTFYGTAEEGALTLVSNLKAFVDGTEAAANKSMTFK